MTDHSTIKGGSFLIDDMPSRLPVTPEDMTDEHRMIRQTAWDFAEKEVIPFLDRIDKQEQGLSVGLLKKAGELGLNAVHIPEEYGGLDLDSVSDALVCEATGACGAFGTTHGAQTGIGALPIIYFGTNEQKEKYLPGLASGESPGAYALTEPSAGSDALGGCRTKAVLSEDGRHYILDGQKIFITNAGWAKTFITYAKVNGDQFTAFIIERDFPGVSVGPEESKMGIKGSSTRSVIFENALIPVENVLHEIGKGHQVAFNILNIGRFKLGAASVGTCKAGLKMAVQYAKVREQFGRPICQFGAVMEKLAQMAILTYMNEAIVHRTAGLFDDILATIPKGDPQYGRKTAEAIHQYAIECSIVKIFGSEAAGSVVDECVQVHGGYGFIDEYPAERAYRDSRITRIYEGTNEINRLIIVTELLKRGRKNELPLMAEVLKLAGDLNQPPKDDIATDGPLGLQRHIISMSKKAALLAAGAAVTRFQTDLTVQQELVMRIADIVAQVYVMESGLLRAMKVREAQGEAESRYHVAMVQAYVDDTAPKIEAWARAALAHTDSGSELKGRLSALRKLMRHEPVDAIDLKRTIAERAIERGEYFIYQKAM